MDNEGITVPVTVGKKVNVNKPDKMSKKSVLFINKKGHAHMMPENMAEAQQEKGKGYILDRSHKDYERLFKAAVGYDDKIPTDKFLQVAGKVTAVTDQTSFAVEDFVAKEMASAARAKKEGGK